VDNLRLVFWAGFFILLWLGVNQWNSDYGAPDPPSVASTQTNAAPTQTNNNPKKAPGVLGLSDNLPVIAIENGPTETSEESRLLTRLVTVKTDVFELGINPDKGGDIVQAKLLKYFPNKDDKSKKIELLSYNEDNYQYFQTGLLSLSGHPEPNHQQAFLEKDKKLELREGQEQISTSLVWKIKQDQTNLEVKKSYTFKRGRYDILLTYDIKNLGTQDYTFVLYNQLVKKDKKEERSMFNVETYSYNGPIIYNGESYQKIDTAELADSPLRETHTNGWASNIQHHFLVAMIPEQNQPYTFSASSDPANELYKVAMVGQTPVTVRPGSRAQVSTTFFVGPKIQEQLKDVAQGLELSVDFGKLTFLSSPLFWLLRKTHQLVRNWGLAIILVTLLIKLLFYPLTEASGRSMAKMRKVQPRIKAIQDRHKDDKQAQSQAMMELYKKEKVNPMAGCLPMLIQIPFFIAFYWVLLESVEIRQAPFFLWIQDLSSRDPYFVLPLLMGLGMFFQQKLNPAPPDPMQAKIMTAMPIMFTAMFAFFPSGLVLYWLTNSLLSIAQQWKINRAAQ
jgi:YidC/Oxa1 family membrane protein insertase